MIAAWMIYTVAITTLLYAAARAAEYVVRALAIPTRVVWAVGMLAALCLSGRAFVNARHVQSVSIAPVHATAAAWFHATIVIGTDQAGGRTRQGSQLRSILHSLLNAAGAASHTLRGVSSRIDVGALERWNVALVALWLAASLAVSAYLLASLIGLRRLKRRFQPASVDQQSVLVSSDVGPALLGVLHSRIVLPSWVLALPRYEREIILAHEREHAAAFDPALVHAAAFAIVLQPWNLGLWAIFARLRLAIEADCDRRVLGVVGDARTYAQLLVTVYQRSTSARVAYVAFVTRPSNLERRIVRMTQAPRLVSIGSMAAMLAVCVLATTAWVAPSPHQRAALSRVVASPRLAGVRQWMHVETAASDEQAGDSGPLPGKGAPLTVVSTTSVIESAVSVSKSTPCIIAGRLSGPAGTDSLRPMSNGCTIDGDVMVMVLDSSRVLVAVHEGADDAPRDVDYLIFTIANGAAPVGLRWWTHDHAEFRNNVFYVASPTPNIPAMAFGGTRAALQTSYPNALPLVYDDMEILRHPSVTWNVLRQLPMAPRCAEGKPIIVVDGAVVEHGDCFVVDGQEFPIA